ncbi:MAG TPA: response regulator [Pyrinomonadaceae bacterium]|jgi:DNA-binding NarL/FixJ family response regulator
MSSILVVDDEATIRDILRELFEPQHVYHAVESVAEAMTLLQEKPFDIVLTDISLPDQSGVELLGIVRQIQPPVPVIIISGIDDSAYARGLTQMGAFGFLAKPFYLDEVVSMVERAIEGRRFSPAQDAPPHRRSSPRYEIQVEARMSSVLVFEQEQDELDDKMLMIMGYTHDISESGLGIVVPEGSLNQETVVGSTFHIVLGLATGALDIEAIAVRYQSLEAEKGYLIGAHITNMSGRDRVLFLQYLYMLSQNQ